MTHPSFLPGTSSLAGRMSFTAMVVISLFVLFLPGSDVPSHVPVNDKLVHGLLFALLAATGRAAGLRPVPLLVALLVYAGASEVLQSALPIHRDGDVRDALADTVGILLGTGAAAAAVLVARRRAPLE